MEPITITVTGADAQVQHKPLLTCGMVGVPVEFTFDESWQGLQKTAVFRVGMTTLDVLDLDTACVVPHALLLSPYRTLRIGVYGCAADGSLVIPTVWADAGQILPGADPSGDTSADPALPLWQQLWQKLENYYTKTETQAYVDGKLGPVSAALDAIIAMQEQLIGGEGA